MVKKTVVCILALTAIGILMTGVASCQASQQADSVEVGPWRFRAQDFIYPGGNGRNVYLFADATATDGWCPKTDRQLTFVDFPFPRTSKPVTVYMHVNPSNTVEELVEAIDTFPTLCALTGIKPPDTIDGLDISAMLHGDLQPLRDFAVTEFPLTRVIRTKEHCSRGTTRDVSVLRDYVDSVNSL